MTKQMTFDDIIGTVSDPVDRKTRKEDALDFGLNSDMQPTLHSSFPLEGESLAETLQRVSASLLKFRVDIEKALEYAYGSYNYDDVVAGVMRGRFIFYTLGNSFAFCELEQAPQYSYFHVFLAGGNMKEVMYGMETYFYDIARDMGAKYIACRGREGWVRALKDQGWEPRYTTLYKEL